MDIYIYIYIYIYIFFYKGKFIGMVDCVYKSITFSQ